MDTPIKLVCFDLNKTLIKENSWLNLNLALGITAEEDQMLMDQYESGKITYEEGQAILERAYKEKGKATKENIYGAVLRYTYLPGAKEIVKYLQERDYRLALISGAIDFLVQEVAKDLDIKYFGANNTFEFDENNYLSAIKTLGKDETTKLSQLQKISTDLNIEIANCACVGDGDNDIEIFKKTGHGITFKGSKIEGYAWKVIENLDQIKQIL